MRSRNNARMGRMARPSKATPEAVELAEQALARGAPVSTAASVAGVSRRTLDYWLASGTVVRRRLHVAGATVDDIAAPDEAQMERGLVASVIRAAQGGDWRAATWLLEHRWPDRYARR